MAVEPFSVGVGVCFGALVGALLVGRARRRGLDERLAAAEQEARAVKRDAARVEGRLKKATIDLAFFHDRVQALTADVERLAGERDEYRRIAATHDPLSAGEPPTHIAVAVWRGRQYSGHPSENLRILSDDLSPHLHRTIELTLSLEPFGGWKRSLRESGPFRLRGPTERVLKELRVLLEDDDLGLMRGSDAKEWADVDSPLKLHVDLDLLDVPAPDVLVRTVQVAKVETRVVERVLERPVLIEVPVFEDRATPSGPTVGMSRNEVLALIEVELESKLGRFGLAKVGEVPARPATDAPEGRARARRGARAIRVERKP